MTSVEHRKVGKWDAIVIFTESEQDYYTISFNGKNGAIISNPSLEIAENKFIEAMTLAESIRKLIYFTEFNKFPDE